MNLIYHLLKTAQMIHLLLIVLVLLQNDAILVSSYFSPSPRWAHIASLIDKRIYFVGGVINLIDYAIDNAYLDLSQNFSTNSPAFYEVETLPRSLNMSFTSAEVVKTKNITELIVFDGNWLDPKKYYIYTCKTDQNKLTWFQNNDAQSGNPGAKSYINTVIDKKGRIYFWGGFRNNTYLEDKAMYIYNTNSTSWTKIAPLNSPSPRFSYTATLLPDGRIIFIGGVGHFYPNPEADLSAILIFNINEKPEDPWSYESAKSVVALGSRRGHTAILASDEYNIIIYGGHDNFTRPANPLMVLDTKTFIWSVPIVESLPNDLSVLSYHTATRYQNLMIIAFGLHDYKSPDFNSSKEIRIFDISNGTFKWLQNYVAPEITETPSGPGMTETAVGPVTTEPSPPNNLGLIIGVLLASIGLIFLGSAFVFILYRRRSTKANNIQGNATNNQVIENSRFQPHLSMVVPNVSNLATEVKIDSTFHRFI
ncbi:hypothetical protein G9A89_004932 [Geosiphon pyriformis]|nr:hypothetical protein G9A89_004932 [Geosiphon pyriformis]